uniref:Uncharacterized protein n=1 Tax=Arundo donax TaxID=35708 RepID=A0A0A8YTN3_ARUDO
MERQRGGPQPVDGVAHHVHPARPERLPGVPLRYPLLQPRLRRRLLRGALPVLHPAAQQRHELPRQSGRRRAVARGRVDPHEQRRAARARGSRRRRRQLVERGEEHRGVGGGRLGLGLDPRVAVELVLEEGVEVGRGERREREERRRRRRGGGEGERRARGRGPDVGAEGRVRVLEGAQRGLDGGHRRLGRATAGEAEREQRRAGAAWHGAAPAVLRAARRAGAPLGGADARGIHGGRERRTGGRLDAAGAALLSAERK